MKSSILWAAVLAGLTGCNRYDLFLIIDDVRTFENAADVLFVIDNSDSMLEESVDLAENFGSFAQRLAGQDDAYGTDGLADAVDRYVDSLTDPALFVDYQLAITTTDAEDHTGRLLGNEPILARGDAGLEDAFLETLMCEATCFFDRAVVPSVPSFECGDPFDDEVSQQYLDCLCGVDAWVANCGGGSEEGLEAVYNAMCRAVDDPPDDCFEDTDLGAVDAGSSAGFLRPGVPFIPVIVTDEGDNSHRVPNREPLPQPYFDLFGDLGVFMAWAVVGPGLDDEFEPVCPGLAQGWATLRYDFFVQFSGGLRLDIHDEGCGPKDFGETLDRLGDLIAGQINAFPLERRPVPGSIAVEVDGRNVDPASEIGDSAFGTPLYSSGWSYREDANTVYLHGDSVPEPGVAVVVYYWPRGAAG